MICDKCGFEHNSKSVCPKCGARVVYVDEEYLKRKKAWEEAQKNGGDTQRDFSRTLPPGIMFSSRDEGDKRPEPDDDIEQEEEAGFFAGLSFDAVKSKITDALVVTVRFFKILAGKRIQRRADKQNTVIRDSVKKTLSGRRKKQLLIIVGAAVIVILAIVAGTRILHKGDSTSIIVYDGKYAYHTDDMDNAIWGSKSGVYFTAAKDSDKFLVWGKEGVNFYNGSEATSLTSSDEDVKIIAKNNDLDIVFFTQNNKYYIYSEQGLKEVKLTAKGNATEESGASDNGHYITFTLFDPASEKYTLIEAKADGTLKEICSGSGRISILNTDSDGNVIYLSMDTAEYGIINEVRLCYYNGDSSSKLADSITDAVYIDDKVFYITEKQKLCKIDPDSRETSVIADKVTAFSDSSVIDSEDSFIYETEDGYYCLTAAEEEPELLFSSTSNALTIYYDIDRDYLYYTDMNSLYYLSEVGGTSEKILDIASGEQIIQLDSCLLAVGSDNVLYEFTDSYDTIDENVSLVQKIDNYNGYTYVKDGARFYRSSPDSSEIQISPEGEKKFTDTTIIYSDSNLYYLDSSSVLWKISMDGDDHTSLGTAKFFMLIR